MPFTNDITTATLTAAMRGGAARQAALAQNVANADTPGYNRISVNFEGALAEALADDRAASSIDPRLQLPVSTMSGERSIDSVKPTFQADTTTTMRVDGSNVDADNEMAELASNQMAYNTVTRLLAERFQQITSAITGR
jgi:flagellar basal-body rod protein FlgB